jgi:hypothetical protein
MTKAIALLISCVLLLLVWAGMERVEDVADLRQASIERNRQRMAARAEHDADLARRLQMTKQVVNQLPAEVELP